MTDRGALNEVRIYVRCVAAAGAFTALLSLSLAPSHDVPTGWAVLLFSSMALSGYLPLRFKFRGEIAGFTLEEAVFLAMLLLLPAGWVPLLAGGGALVGHALQRQPLVKVAFNAGQIALWSSAATWAFHAVAERGMLFAPRTLLGVAVAALVLNLVSLAAIAELFRRLEGRPWAATAEDVVPVFAFTTTGNVSAGFLLAFVLEQDPRAAIFLGVMMVGLYLGYRGYAGALEERERNDRLHDVSQTLASATGSPHALGRFLEQLAKLFSGNRAEIVVILRERVRYLSMDPEHGVTERDGKDLPWVLDEALHAGRALLHSETDSEANHRDALAAPLLFEETTVGAIAVYDRHGLEPWDDSDIKLLASLANEAAVAVKNVELVAELSEESRKLGDIVGAASDGIALVDAHGRIVTVNPAFQRMTALRSGDVVGRPWRDVLVAADDRSGEELDRAMRSVLGGRRVDHPVDLHLVRREKEHRWLRITLAPVEPHDLDEDGRTDAVLVARDVTREREAEELKADFIATVSHELRTPLTPLKGFLATAESHWDRLDREQLREMITAMGRQVGRLEALINDLLTIADLDRGGLDLSGHEIDLSEVVEDAVQALPVDALARVQVRRTPSLRAMGDAHAVRRIVRALADNALKHTTGAVTVTIAPRGAQPAVSVSDEGPGIEEWDRERIFERFGRLGDHLTRGQGPGLGLAIAQSLAERLGGRLELESAVERGSTFVLVLPAPASDTVATAG